MTIPPIPPLGSVAAGPAAPGPAGPAAPGFADAIQRGLAEVSGGEHNADQVAQTLAAGGPAEIHDLMAATTKASLGVDLLVQVRNRAVEAYQEVMRLQL